MSDPMDPYRSVDPAEPAYPLPPEESAANVWTAQPEPAYPQPPTEPAANAWAAQPEPAYPQPPTEPAANVWAAQPEPTTPPPDPYGATPYSGAPYGGAPVSGPPPGYAPPLPVPYAPAPAAYPPVQPYPPMSPQAAGDGVGHPAAVLLVRPPNSGVAVAAMVLGIIGFVSNVCTCGIPSLVAIALGHVGLSQTKSGAIGGRGMAVTGLVLGYLIFVPVIIFIVFFGGLTFVGGIFGVAGAASSP